MKKKDVLNILNDKFLIEMIEVLDFEARKDRALLNVLTIEKGSYERKYQLLFADVIAFDFWKAPLDLDNDELSMFTDGKSVKPLNEVEKYKNMEFHQDLINRVENPDEYWCLDLMSAGFRLSVVFREVSVKQL